jgi:hypothetical protein
MPLHNTEELKAAPTSQMESEVLDDQTDMSRKGSTRPSTINCCWTATPNRISPPSARLGSNLKSGSSWTSPPTRT